MAIFDLFFALQWDLLWISMEATHFGHCHLICCVYIKGHVETVNTKDQSNAIVYWV